MRVEAFAKVNLSLRVRPPDASGLHPLWSLAQSIGWADMVGMAAADEDAFDVRGPSGVPRDESNLAWRALAAVRAEVPGAGPVRLTLEKQIPEAAGLGGGSADAAAVLVLAAEHFSLSAERRDALAAGLGADIPFCLTGGTALLEGYGEQVTPLPPVGGYAMAVVVPPFPLVTSEVYRRWDALEGPAGPGCEGPDLPVSLREHAPLVNDLTPAARDLNPDLGDWMADLSRAWEVPVLMSGSGPALFGFFPTREEAADAVGGIRGARGSAAVTPMAAGRRASPG